jgi:hypothetical protein
MKPTSVRSAEANAMNFSAFDFNAKILLHIILNLSVTSR